MRLTIPPTLWFENEAGDRWIPTDDELTLGPAMPVPDGYDYSCFRFPHMVTERCYRMRASGRQSLVVETEATWPADLVERMVQATGNDPDGARRFALYDAILVAASACSRCLNALYYRYTDGHDGYAEDSEEYRASLTRCLFCETEAEAHRPMPSLPQLSTPTAGVAP